MSKTISFDDIVSKADEDYGTLTVTFAEGDSVVLRNALQLSREERAALTSKSEDAENDDQPEKDQIEALGETLTVVATDKDAAARFLAHVGDNLAYLVTVFKTYNEGTQAGEA